MDGKIAFKLTQSLNSKPAITKYRKRTEQSSLSPINDFTDDKISSFLVEILRTIGGLVFLELFAEFTAKLVGDVIMPVEDDKRVDVML